jgi:hypothetical protein
MSKCKPKSGQKVAPPTAPTHAPARRLQLEPGQPSGYSHLTDAVEQSICEKISEGVPFIDAARLSGLHRSTVWSWRVRGEAFIDKPEEHPGDERYGLFVERLAVAESRCKQIWIDKVSRAGDLDWRALAFLLKVRWPKEFTEFVRTELSGVDGEAIQVNNQNQFKVIVEMSGDPAPNFTVVDHSQPHRESAQLEDPFATHDQSLAIDSPAIPNRAEELAQSQRNQKNARQRWDGSHPYSRIGKVK